VEFTAQQLRAIDIAGLGQDTCVVAGPGSGKTTVLVERFRRLVCEAGIPPSQILAITFTEKAATNMKQKLAAAFRDRPEDRRQLERAYVSTVHGFCMRLLRENAIFAGIDPEFRVMDERQADTLQAVAVSQALDAMFAEDPERMRRLMEGFAGADLAVAAIEVYEALRSSGAGIPSCSKGVPGGRFADLIDRARGLAQARPVNWTVKQKEVLHQAVEWGERHRSLRDLPPCREQFAALDNFDCKMTGMKRSDSVIDRLKSLKKAVDEDAYRELLTEYYAPERQTLLDVLRRFDQTYRARKAAAAVVDYSDLEEATVRLLEENDGVRERVRAQFDQVLMDEFQDTNGLQARLLKLVRAADNFYAVGDINQSIYGFRHAEPRVFREYRDEVERSGKPLAELTENWRSRAGILSAVTRILDGADGIEPRPLVAARKFEDKAGPSVEVLVASAADADSALALETRWVARRILELGDGRFGEIAVLVRNSEVMGAFAAAFEEAGIPYLVGRGRGFYEGREITDLIHMLRVLLNPQDEISMAAVLRSPLVGLSDEALLRLKQSGNLGKAVRSLEMKPHDPVDMARLERFRADLRDWRVVKDYTAFDLLLQRAMDAAGYAHTAGSREAANVEKFLAIAREAASRLTLAGFVDELDLVRASNPRDTDAPPEDATNAVRVLTVHAAKGLEFPIVFVAAIHKGMDTKLGDLSFSPDAGLGARWRNPASGESKDDVIQHANRQERKQREIDEGNRLFYVAMTRAEEHLVLSYSRTETAPKNWAGLLEERWDGPVTRVTKPPDALMRKRTALERPAPLVLPRPALAGQYDSNATVTSIAAFAACPRRYYLERYLRWQAPAPPPEVLMEAVLTMPASEFGSQAHAVLAGTATGDVHPEALRLAESFRSSGLGKRAARATRVEREFDFLLAVEDVVLRGQIDLWFEDKGELILVDYKTDTVTTAREAERHAEAYGEQLRLYALAIERVAGRLPDHAYIYFLRRNEAIPADLSPLALQATQNLVREFRDAQETLAFPLKAGDHCPRCPYFRNLCPAEMISLSSCDEPLSSLSSPYC
jgi:ATP-dependent exoDNAse (exonuclease V) beta subunit